MCQLTGKLRIKEQNDRFVDRPPNHPLKAALLYNMQLHGHKDADVCSARAEIRNP